MEIYLQDSAATEALGRLLGKHAASGDAKIIPNIVPFGPSFPGQKGIGHNPNEWMDRSDLILNAKIYALSIVRLANGEND